MKRKQYLILTLFFAFAYGCVTLCEPIKNPIIYVLYGIGAVCIVPFVQNRNNGINLIAMLMLLLPFVSGISEDTSIMKYLFYWLTFIVISIIREIPITIVKTSTFSCFIHVIATWMFFLIPSLYLVYYYSYGINIYESMPGGVEDIATGGYRAALTSHYSANALYITMSFLGIVCLGKSIGKYKFYVMLLLSMVALLLTTKRAHLLFGIMSLFFVFFYENKKHASYIIRKIIVVSIVSGVIAIIVYSVFPDVFMVFDRFENSDGDISSGRFGMWEKAFEYWSESPIFGIGWMNFQNRYLFYNGYVTYNTHNVYIQLLCETGVVGIVIFLMFLFKSLKVTFYLLKRINSYVLEDRIMIRFCSVIVCYFTLYSFTGNCIYDNSLFYFLMADGCIFSIYLRLKNS